MKLNGSHVNKAHLHLTEFKLFAQRCKRVTLGQICDSHEVFSFYCNRTRVKQQEESGSVSEQVSGNLWTDSPKEKTKHLS